MTILKVMFAVAIGTYVAYEITTRSRKDGSHRSGREVYPSNERVPVKP